MFEKTIREFQLPPIPACKICYAEKKNPEIDAIFKTQNGEELSPKDEDALKEAISFYKVLFPALKRINLGRLSMEEALSITEYLNKAIDFSLLVRNDMTFDRIYRISVADDSFREKGKIRDVKYLKYPPAELVKKWQRYNRANTFNRTVFYATSNWHIALLETKPQLGQKIIMSVWEPLTNELFNSYPISNVPVDNENVQDATKYLVEYGKSTHPLCTGAMNLILEFLASEFVKDIPATNPNRLEYFYSAYFSDIILGPIISDDPDATCDLIRYPSVAWNHKLDNIAMNPYCLDERMRITHAVEFEVEEIFYEQTLPLEQCPAKLRFIREATWFEGDLIVWEDE